MSEPPRPSQSVLTVDLGAIVANYRLLRSRLERSECAVVVKADAYGLGAIRVAPALAAAGARHFFVAHLGEALEIRAVLPSAARIYVLNGMLNGEAEEFRARGVVPVLNDLEQIEVWAREARRSGGKLPAIVHFDTGMSRLGLSDDEADRLVADPRYLQHVELGFVMSHLACADEPGHAKNEAQRKVFDRTRTLLPQALPSLANSAGILLGPDFLYDLVRPGIALYGGHPRREGTNPFQPVVHLAGRILQVRDTAPGETIGYGATRTLKKPTRVAVVSVGYADGFFRALSTEDGEEGFLAYAGPHPAPILGRVSMDLITIDVSKVPEDVSKRGAFVELIGPNVSAQTMAHHAGTIDYEVLTNLGRRALRRYLGG